jgi:hypothetical protein
LHVLDVRRRLIDQAFAVTKNRAEPHDSIVGSEATSQ